MSRLYCRHLTPADEHCPECSDGERIYSAEARKGAWLAFLWLERDVMEDCGTGFLDAAGQPKWTAEWESLADDGATVGDVYIHCKAARMWQYVRDFFNGTPEKWGARLDEQYNNGFDEQQWL